MSDLNVLTESAAQMAAKPDEPVALADLSRPPKGQAPGYQVPVHAEPEEAPLYLVLRKVFLHNRLYEPGETVRYADKPGTALQLIEAAPANPAEARTAAETAPTQRGRTKAVI